MVFGRFPCETYVGAARERHARVVAEEVVPEVDARYRTRPSRDSRALVGGHSFIGGEVGAGSGWASWRTRTDRLLEALFPAR